MRYWVFNEQQLADALAAHEATRQRENHITEQQAKDESQVVLTFLSSAAVRHLAMTRNDARG